MTTHLSEAVRSGCRAVAEAARQVRVRSECVAALAAAVEPGDLEPPPLDPDAHWLGRGRETTAFLLTLDAVNFGSGWFADLGPGLDGEDPGYFAIARGLRRRFEREGPPTALDLAEADAEACAATFGQDLGNPAVRALMGLFAAAWNQLGRLALDRYDGDVAGLVDAADGSAAELVRRLCALPFFVDVAPYRGAFVPLLKRAQIAAADLALAGVELEGIERLTCFADDLVPHVLRTEGCLEYAPALAQRIAAADEIPAQSEAEVEIRACAVHAVELLRAELEERGIWATSVALDWWLWNRGQAARYAESPRHRTRTVYY